MRTRTLLARIERAEQSVREPLASLVGCTCFPSDEQPEFRWRTEAETAATVLCPIHGLRFQTVVTRFLFRALWHYLADVKRGWPHRSPQYQKAMRASFDLALLPIREVVDCEDETMLILRDGSQMPSGGTAIGYKLKSCGGTPRANTNFAKSDQTC